MQVGYHITCIERRECSEYSACRDEVEGSPASFYAVLICVFITADPVRDRSGLCDSSLP